jgi:transcriptional regulator with XRE-family HTH domain
LKVSAIAAAESAGLSRVTLHRIERGEASVTMGAYFSVAAVLGLEFALVDPSVPRAALALPDRIRIADYPALRRLAWQMSEDTELTPQAALNLYERNWRHVDRDSLSASERSFVRQLADAFGGGRLLV